MLHETYTLTSPQHDVKYLYFPRGRDNGYHLMELTKPLRFGEDGYDEIDIRVRGLPLLRVNDSKLYAFPRQLHQCEILAPIFVVRKEHFLNKCIRFREGQKYIFGRVDATNSNEDIDSQLFTFVVSTFVY